jgi:DNA end-binding protein Ku
VGIAKVVIRTRQYLAAVVARGDSDVLTLELMRYAHELRDPSELEVPRGKSGVSDKELQMAERLVEGMVEAWDPEKYKDDYRRDLMKTIEERVEAGELEESSAPAPKPERPSGKVLDLMSLLKSSLEQGATKKPAGKKSAAKKPARKPARKAAKKKAPAAKKRKSA